MICDSCAHLASSTCLACSVPYGDAVPVDVRCRYEENEENGR